eukprot:SM000029S10500  [mRNA]  locus=s29:385562:395793:- [translate_table: standard]
MPLPVRMLGSASTCPLVRTSVIPCRPKHLPESRAPVATETPSLPHSVLEDIVGAEGEEAGAGAGATGGGGGGDCGSGALLVDVTPQGKLPEVATQDGHRNDRLGHRIGLRVGVSVDCQSGVVLWRAESCVQERVHKARVYSPDGVGLLLSWPDEIERHHQVVKATSDIAVPVLVARQDDDHLVVVGEVPELGEGLDVKGQGTDDVGQCQGWGANRSSERLGLIMSRSWPAHAGLPCLVYTTERAMSNVNAATWPPATPTVRKLTATSPVLAVAVAERLATLLVAGEAAASTCHWSLVPWCHSSVDKEIAFTDDARDTGEPEEGGKERAWPADYQSPATSHPVGQRRDLPKVPNADACETLCCRAEESAGQSDRMLLGSPLYDICTSMFLASCHALRHGLYVSKNGHISSREVRAGHGRNVLDCEQVEALGAQDLAKVPAELIGGPPTAGCPDIWYTTNMLAEASPVLRLSSVARAVRLRLREELLLETVKLYVQVAPPSVETSTEPIWVALASEPGSVALPLIVTEAPCAKEDPECGVVVLVSEATAVFLHNRNRLALTGTCTTSTTVSNKSHKKSFILCQIQTCKDDEDWRFNELVRTTTASVETKSKNCSHFPLSIVCCLVLQCHEQNYQHMMVLEMKLGCGTVEACATSPELRGKPLEGGENDEPETALAGIVHVAVVAQLPQSSRPVVEFARRLRGGAGGRHRCRSHHARSVAVVPTEPQHAERRKSLASGHLDLHKCRKAAGTAPTVVTASEHKQQRARMLPEVDDLRACIANSVVNGKEAARGDTLAVGLTWVLHRSSRREGKGKDEADREFPRGRGGPGATLKLTALPGS